jgi:hypothetical protein
VLQELKPFAAALEEDDPRQTDVATLQRVFGSYSLSPAVQTELRRVRNHKLTDDALFSRLRDIYDQHNMARMHGPVGRDRQVSIPRIICSEWLA